MNAIRRRSFHGTIARRTALLLALCGAVEVAWARGTTLSVPTPEYPTIQSAVDAAQTGDQVVVADGTYTGPGNVEVNLLGKAIVVRSMNGAAACTIDCEGGSTAFRANTSEGSDTIVQGFTIRRGARGFSCFHSSPTILACTFIDCSAETGGALGLDISAATVRDCTFQTNSAMLSGGGINIYAGAPLVENCTFIDQFALFGGGIACAETGATIVRCSFIDCAANAGAGVSLLAAASTIVDCQFTENLAEFGAGMEIDTSPAIVRGCRFDRNSTFITGGPGPYAGGGISIANSPAVIEDCTFNANAGDRGGAMNIDRGPGEFEALITSCSFTENTSQLGGAVFIFDSQPRFEKCAFERNSVNSTDDLTGGGAIRSDSASPVISACTFTENSVTGTARGGTFYCTGPGNPRIEQSSFLDNEAPVEGAAILAVESDPLVVGTLFARNTGGAVACFDNSPTFVNCSFVANSNPVFGRSGGITGTGARTGVIGCTFVGNSASFAAAAVHGFGGGTLHIADCTLTANSSPSRGAVGSSGTMVSVVNSVLWENVGGAFSSTPPGALAVSYTDVEGGHSGTGNIDADPRFAQEPSPGPDGLWGTPDDDAGDLSLLAASPCIDAGSNTALPSDVADLDHDTNVLEPLPRDLLGASRRIDAPGTPDTGEGAAPIVDIGAYEFPGDVKPCPCDWNASGELNSQDYFDFLSAFFAGDADFNDDKVTNSQDYFDFLTCFFTGC